MQKFLAILIGSLVLYGCSDTDKPVMDSLESLYRYQKSEYALAKVRLENTIMESSNTANNNDISAKLKKLDSMLITTVVNVDESTNKEAIQLNLANWENKLLTMTNFEFPMAKIEPQRTNVFKHLAKLRIQQNANKMIEFLSVMEGATPLYFDSLRLVVVPQKSTVKVGEKYLADIYYCATSSSAEDIVELSVNDRPVMFEDGVGYIQFIPTRKGTSSYTVKTKSLKDFVYKEDLELETTVNYKVE